MSILRRGMKGAPVKRMQEMLGVAADGDFGPGTEKAVKEFQKSKGLAVDGVAGPDTFTAMGLYELVLLRRGSRGEAVKTLQEGLGIGADGIFGGGTEKAVKDFQAAHGLKVDGIAGPKTLAKLDSFAAITEETVKKAEVRPDEKGFASEPMPEIKGAEVVEGSEGEDQLEETSIWSKVTGWFKR